MNLRRWLRPGMGIKRWLGVVFIGELSLALGGAFALRQLYRDTDVSGPFQATIYLATLQFLPYIARGIILGSLGAALFLAGSILVIQAFINFHSARRTPTSPSSSSSTRSGSSPAARRSSRSAAGPVSRRSSAG